MTSGARTPREVWLVISEFGVPRGAPWATEEAAQAWAGQHDAVVRFVPAAAEAEVVRLREALAAVVEASAGIATPRVPLDDDEEAPDDCPVCHEGATLRDGTDCSLVWLCDPCAQEALVTAAVAARRALEGR